MYPGVGGQEQAYTPMCDGQASAPMCDGQEQEIASKVVESNDAIEPMDVTSIATTLAAETNIPTETDVSIERSSGRQRKQTSDVWNHFKKVKIDNHWKAICNYCDAKLLGEPSQGTSHLRNHFRICRLRTTRDIRQAFIKTEKTKGETVVIGSYAFNQEVARRDLVKMITLHEYPMSIVEHVGFKDFCSSLQPLFKVNCRSTIRSDIMKRFEEEKKITRKLLVKNEGRVAITTDMWTASNQNKGYMAITAHFIDDSWKLQSRLVRWNSTFTMLHVASQYKDVFNRLSQRESQYMVAPNDDDWKMADDICKRLELFFDVTRLFSGTLYPTTNVYFPKICQIKLALIEWVHCPNLVIHEMAKAMIAKFDKYWGVINGVMAVGAIFDPRFKMELLYYFFPLIYGNKSDEEIGKVQLICQQLVNEYTLRMKGKETISPSLNPNTIGVDRHVGKDEMWLSGYQSYVIERKSVNAYRNSELEHYLEEPVLPINHDMFDILNWWKANQPKYPILHTIAKDFLAIPVSTVASESSFSTGGRFLTPQRSRLLPDTLEAMMCLQSWLWTDITGSSKLNLEVEGNSVLEDVDPMAASCGPSSDVGAGQN